MIFLGCSLFGQITIHPLNTSTNQVVDGGYDEATLKKVKK